MWSKIKGVVSDRTGVRKRELNACLRDNCCVFLVQHTV